MDAKEYGTEREVSLRFGVGIRQLRLMRTAGVGPRFFKTSGRVGERGGRVRYRFADVEKWVASRPSGGEQGTPKAAWPPAKDVR